MRTLYAGYEPLTQAFYGALNGAPCDTPNMFVEMVHPDDAETIAFLIAESRKHGIDLFMLHPTEKEMPGSVAVAGMTLRMRCVLILEGRFADHQCVPFVISDKRTLLVPVDVGCNECFVMGERGQFIRLGGRPKLEQMSAGIASATKRIEEYLAVVGDDAQMAQTRH